MAAADEFADFAAELAGAEGVGHADCVAFGAVPILGLVEALDEPGHKNAEPDLGWSAVAKGGVEVIDLPGTHNQFIEQPDRIAVRSLPTRRTVAKRHLPVFAVGGQIIDTLFKLGQ